MKTMVNIITCKMLWQPLKDCVLSSLGNVGIRLIEIDGFAGISGNVEAGLWIIEALSEPSYASGFHLAKDNAGTLNPLLLFINVPRGFPRDGSFWCDILTTDLKKKLPEALKMPLPSLDQFEALANAWDILKLEKDTHR